MFAASSNSNAFINGCMEIEKCIEEMDKVVSKII